MKNIICALAIIVGLINTGYAGARLEITSAEEVKLGTFAANLAQQAVFKIKNGGDESLIIKTVRKTCGCFTIKSFPKELEPGKAGEIVVDVAAYGLSSAFSKLVFVSSNDPVQSTKSLKISGEAVPLYAVSPTSKHNAGKIRFSESIVSKTFSFTIKPVNNQTLDLDEPALKYENWLIKLTKNDDASYLCEVTLKDGLKPGRFRQVIPIAIKAPKGWKPIELIIFGQITK